MAHGILRDMVDKWTVSILLECFLVFIFILFLGSCCQQILDTRFAPNLVRLSSLKGPIMDPPLVNSHLSGSTPLGMYKKLIEFHKAGEISFKYVKTFNMDEYVGML